MNLDYLSIAPEQVVEGAAKIIGGAESLSDSLGSLKDKLRELQETGFADSDTLKELFIKVNENVNYLEVKAQNLKDAGLKISSVGTGHQDFETSASNSFRM